MMAIAVIEDVHFQVLVLEVSSILTLAGKRDKISLAALALKAAAGSKGRRRAHNDRRQRR
jgi:hypothetical protein